MLRRLRVLSILFATAAMIFAFNNCGQKRFEKTDNIPFKTAQGNGDAYSGKLAFYNHYDPAQACTDLKANGVPLPNSQIMITQTGVALVRDNCQDIPPQILLSTQLTSNPDGTITYNNKTYSLVLPNEFEIRQSQCPPSRTPISGPRMNIFETPLDLGDATTWDMKGGMSATLAGSFASLPAYRVNRTRDATLENWLRISQYHGITRNKTYVISFFAKRETSNTVRLLLFNNVPQEAHLMKAWNLNTGAEIDSFNVGVNIVYSRSEAISGGYYFSVAFQVTANVPGVDIGISSNDLGLNQAIVASGPQFEDADQFCQP